MPFSHARKLADASLERRNESIDAAVTITQTIDSHRQVSRAIRSQFAHKSSGFELTVPDFDLNTLESGPEDDLSAVEVRIERTVKVERRPKKYELENYSRNFGNVSRESNRSRQGS